jgi:hypothetical protein
MVPHAPPTTSVRISTHICVVRNSRYTSHTHQHVSKHNRAPHFHQHQVSHELWWCLTSLLTLPAPEYYLYVNIFGVSSLPMKRSAVEMKDLGQKKRLSCWLNVDYWLTNSTNGRWRSLVNVMKFKILRRPQPTWTIVSRYEVYCHDFILIGKYGDLESATWSLEGYDWQ